MKLNPLIALIETRVSQVPDGRIWSYDRDNRRSETYGCLWRRSAAIAGGLLTVRASADRRPVVLLIRDVVDFVPAFWACIRAGAMAVPLTGLAADPVPDRRDESLRKALSRLDRPVILFDAPLAEVAQALGSAEGVTLVSLAQAVRAPPLFPDRACAEPFCLIPTSGSTGGLKLVALAQEAMLHRPMSIAPCTEAERCTTVSLFPYDTISGLRVVFLTCHTWVHIPLPVFAANPLSTLDAIAHHRATTLSILNTLADMLATAAAKSDRAWDLSTLHRVLSGSERVVPAVMQRLRDLLMEHGASAVAISANYGTTETALLVTGADPLGAAQAETGDGAVPLGKSAPGVELRIAAEDGEVLDEGKLGEVQALCPLAMFSGYWGEPDETRAGFTADGWWRTGDVGRLQDGVLTLHGRVKEIVIVNGRKHSLADIDAHLQAHLGSEVRAYACAVHFPGEVAERLVVVFSMRDEPVGAIDAAAARIRGAIGRRFGVPARPIYTADPDRIPMTSAGKIRRNELAQRVRDSLADP